MQAHAQDAGVFIRSMATRGHLGGLARTTARSRLVLDAAGFDVVIIETVGVGQDEVDVVRTADVAIVPSCPATGDDVQALKAGIMEIADIFVVNKADREGADRTAASIQAMLSLEQWKPGTWRPPVVRTEATTGRGVAGAAGDDSALSAATRGRAGRAAAARAEWRLRELLGRGFLQHVERQVLAPGEFDRLLDQVAARETDPYRRGRRRARSRPGRAAREGGRGRPCRAGRAGSRRRRRARPGGRARGSCTTRSASTSDEPEDVPSQRVRVQFVATGAVRIELVEPLPTDSPVAKFLRTAGPGPASRGLRVHRPRRGPGPAAPGAAFGSSTRRRARAPTARASRSSIRPQHGRGPGRAEGGGARTMTTWRVGDFELMSLSDGTFRGSTAARCSASCRSRCGSGGRRPTSATASAGDAAAAGPDGGADRSSSTPASATRSTRRTADIYGLRPERHLDHVAGARRADRRRRRRS